MGTLLSYKWIGAGVEKSKGLETDPGFKPNMFSLLTADQTRSHFETQISCQLLVIILLTILGLLGVLTLTLLLEVAHSIVGQMES